MIKRYIAVFALALSLVVGVAGYVNAQTATSSPTTTPSVSPAPTSVPAAAPATGFGTM